MQKTTLLAVLLMAILIISCDVDSIKEEKKNQIKGEVVNEMHPEWTASSNIYEVNVRQYTPEGTFAAFDMHIDRLADMGVDILWFMPISPIGEKNRKKGLGSYYSVKDYIDVNPEFGTAADFHQIIEHAHERGMHVIIDWVANHTAWDHNWVTEHPDWYQMDEEGILKSPFDWTDVVALNYDNKDLRIEMTKQMEFWIDSFNIDGFRCDVASMVPTDFWDSTRAVLNQKKEVFMLAEAEEPALNKKAFESSYAWAMHHRMATVAKDDTTPQVLINQINDDIAKFGNETYMMQFTTNHDENSWNGTEFEKMGDAYEIMAALTYVVPGMPLIYNGQESKNAKRLLFFEKDTIIWGEYEMLDFYTNMIKLKKENKALWNGSYGGDFNVIKNSDQDNSISFSRKLGENTIIFIGNFSIEPSDMSYAVYPEELSGDYINWQTKEKVKMGKMYPVYLEAWQYMILVK